MPGAGGKENLEALLASLRAQLQRLLVTPGTGPKALAAVQAVLSREAVAGAGRTQRAALAAQLQQHLAALLAGAPVPPPVLPPPLALPPAQALAAAVRRRCGDGAARAIASRLQAVLHAGEQGGEWRRDSPVLARCNRACSTHCSLQGASLRIVFAAVQYLKQLRHAAIDPLTTGGGQGSIPAQFSVQQPQAQQPWPVQQPLGHIAAEQQMQQAWLVGGTIPGMQAMPTGAPALGGALASPAAAAPPMAALAAFGLTPDPGQPPVGFPGQQQ